MIAVERTIDKPIETPPSFSKVETSIHSKKRKINYGDIALCLTNEALKDDNSSNSSILVVPNDTTTNTIVAKSNVESRIQFLTVHFKILQALYKDKSLTDYDDLHLDTCSQHYPQSNSTTNSNTTIIDATNIWYHIQSFMMHQRESLLQIQQRIEHISNIHHAALEYCPTKSTTVNSKTALNNPRHDVKAKEANQKHFLSNPVVSSSSSSRRKSTNDSFRIIANMIGQQSTMIQQQKQVPTINVLQQLLQEVTKRIASLQEIYIKQCQRPASIQATSFQIYDHKPVVQGNEDLTVVSKRLPTIDEDRSYRTELQYKIHLWSLLAHDLKEVLRN